MLIFMKSFLQLNYINSFNITINTFRLTTVVTTCSAICCSGRCPWTQAQLLHSNLRGSTKWLDL